jgi:large subunit ribosomal protein L5
MSYVPRISEDYRKNVIPDLMKKFSYKNVNQVPKLVKIVVNMGVGEANENPKLLESAVEDLKLIVGQKPITTHARKAISNFKLREGVAIGCAVTLRRDRMFEFLDRLISMAIPRVRDFRGLSPTSFDGRGNYNLGLKEQIIFPEIDYDKVDKVRGLNITIVTTAKSDEEAYALLSAMGLPFRKKS